jgi:hypothetical protein
MLGLRGAGACAGLLHVGDLVGAATLYTSYPVTLIVNESVNCWSTSPGTEGARCVGRLMTHDLTTAEPHCIQRSVIPDSRYETKGVASDCHPANGRKRQVSGHQ